MGLILESSAYAPEAMIPSKFTCDGANVSPPLKWSNVPEETRSFALIFDDPDAPAQTWVHWVVYNIPGDQNSMNEDIPAEKKLANGAIQGNNDFKNYGYGGPCPPSGMHRYFLKLYALDTLLALKPGATKQQLLDAMDGHILESAVLIGKYKRS